MWVTRLTDSQRDALKALIAAQGEVGPSLSGAYEALDLSRWDEFVKHVRFAGGGFLKSDPGSLLDVIAEAEADLGGRPALLHYLAIPPTAFARTSEAIKEHMGLSSKAAAERITELLAKVGIPRPKDRLNDYPFQFSDGMRRRVMIAIALSCDPKLILADEPTTALDVTIQAQILEVMRDLRAKNRMAIMLITHDLGVVAEMADEGVVMYAGEVVERADGRTAAADRGYRTGRRSHTPPGARPRAGPAIVRHAARARSRAPRRLRR
jgi:hypothetical protein